MFTTPTNRRTVIVFAWCLFLTAPLLVARYYYVELGRGAFPIDADSIGIPIIAFVVLLFTMAPITWGFVWLCVRRYPGATSLAAWNPARPIWSGAWTLLVGTAGAMFLLAAPWRDALHHPLFIGHNILDVYFLLILRSSIVSQGSPPGHCCATACTAPKALSKAAQ